MIYTPKQRALMELWRTNKLRRINLLEGSVSSGKTSTSFKKSSSFFRPGRFTARTGTGPTLSDKYTFCTAEDVFLEMFTNFLPVESTPVTP